MEEDHTSHYAQAPREPRRAKRHACQNCPDDVFRVHVMYPTTNIFNNNKNIQIKTEILLYLHNIHFLKHVTLA